MRNIVLVVLDTVRKDYFDRNAPELQRRASVSFEECRTTANATLPSHASMLTGDLPSEHGIGVGGFDGFDHLDPADTFLGDLPDYRTAGVSANPHLRSEFGFDELFDGFSSLSPYRRFEGAIDLQKIVTNADHAGVRKYTHFLSECLACEKPLKSILNGGLVKLNELLFDLPVPRLLDDGTDLLTTEATELATDGSEPFFLFLNLMEAHAPHKNTLGYRETSVPDEWNSGTIDMNDINNNENVAAYTEDIEQFRELYAATIEYLDRKVATMVDRIQRQTERPTTVIVTADHGENLAADRDDHLIGHISSLTESLIHVPLLLINPPSGYEATETAYFSQSRLGELITGLAENRTPAVFDDRIGAECLGADRCTADGRSLRSSD